MTFQKFFGHDIDYSKAATMFTYHHIILICFALLSIFATLHFAAKIRLKSNEKRIKHFVAILLIFLEIAYHIHNWTYPRISVPLHVCSFAVIMNIILLYTDSKKIFNYAFFFGVLGGFMALFIPNSLGYTYYNFRYYHFIILHSLLIIVPMYYYKAYHYRVSYRTMLKTFRFSVLSGIVVYIINGFLNTNYWFISYIPSNVSGFFTNWNIYIVTFIFTVFFTMNLLWFISNVKDFTNKKNNN
ncbi:MAG: TIGR02206 family membrane protein [Bacilli bacterium]|nr:TIGR02206 family membrane protein [Bacilli bacterium]